jgi:hypothetical protein
MDFFQALRHTRQCLLALSMHKVVAKRVRIMPAVPVMIEIDRPMEVLGLEVTTINDYMSVPFYGCSVVWKNEGVTDGQCD